MVVKANKGLINKNPEIDLSILKSLRKITRSIDLNSKRLSSESSLTAPQILSLLAVYEKGSLTIAKIANEVHLSASTMVGIVDRLEMKNLVVRERSKTDRRQVMVNITNEGKKLAKKLPAPLQEKLLDALSKLSDNQQKNIVKALDLLVEMLGAENLNVPPVLAPEE